MQIDKTPQLAYWHLWTDANGVSRQTRCLMREFKLESISEPASPQWQGKRTTAELSVMVTILPVGWMGTWHENPKPQWIIPLSGRWSVESMDGQRIEMGPGEISFGADQNTKELDGKKGHRSTTIGDQPAVLMLIQFETGSPTQSPLLFPLARSIGGFAWRTRWTCLISRLGDSTPTFFRGTVLSAIQ